MKLHRIVAIVMLLGLGACAGPQIFQHQLIGLNQGMQPSEVASVLKLEPLSSHESQVDKVRYTFQRYDLNNGMQRATYLIAYEEGKLTYWGYIDDFRRHPDKRLVQAANNVVPAVLTVR